MQTVCIFGLGYVGREVASAAFKRGYSVVGIDKDPGVISAIEDGTVCTDVEFTELTTDSESVVKSADVIVAAVPTPVNGEKVIELDALKSITEVVGDLEYDNPPLYVVESTIPPGTISDVVLPILRRHDLKIGEDIFVAHAPERINPGTTGWNLSDIPRVVGASTDTGLQRALSFYGDIIDAKVHGVDSPAIAEASKIIENSYRDVNIAFVNEIALALDHLNIDTDAALDAAATKPFGFKRFYPGVGVGGHCIPIDLYFLIRKSQSEGFNNQFLSYAREINDGMPIYVAEKTIKELNNAEILPNGSRAVLLGAAFKSNVEDTRNSPYYNLKSELEDYGVAVDTYDPMVPELSTVDTPYISADVAVLVTAHDEFQSISFEELSSSGVSILIDGRNEYSPAEVRAAGLRYSGIGR